MTTTEGVAASTVSKGGSVDENGDGADAPMYENGEEGSESQLC